MPSVSRGAQAFLKTTDKMLKQAQREGANVTKAQVTKALEHLTADGKVGQADVKAARTFLESAPLTAGAKDALKNFVGEGPRSTDRGNSPLNLRLRGGGEAGGGRAVRGGGEAGGGGRAVRGGEAGGGGGGRTVRGGGEAGGSGRAVRGGGEAGGGGRWSGTFGGGGGSFGGGE